MYAAIYVDNAHYYIIIIIVYLIKTLTMPVNSAITRYYDNYTCIATL